MAELWRIELLDGLRAVHADHTLTRFRTQKAGALLAYLAFYAHRAHSRDQLIEALWPDEDLYSARDRLRVALSSLRRQLEPPGIPAGAVIVASRHSVQINPAAISTDVARFEAAIRSAGDGATDQMERLATVVELYRGPLLPGHFEAWVLPEQQRLEGLFFHAAGLLVRLMEQAGDLGKALDVAGRAAAAGPLREEVQREFIHLLARVGQPTAALDQYRRMDRRLREELDESPSEAMLSLIAEIKRQADTPTWDVETALPVNGGATALELAGHPAPPAADSFPSPPAGTVTFLLARIDGFSAPAAEEREAPTAGERCRSLLDEAIHHHGGHRVQEAEDVVLAAFAGAGPALAAAVAAQRRLTGGASAARLPRVTMALHTGEVVWSGREYEGPALQQVARILSVAEAGQILCSELTAGIIQNGPTSIQEPDVQLVDQGVCQLPAPAEPERLLQVQEAVPSPLPLIEPSAEPADPLPLQPTRFIGRAAGLAQLITLLRSPEARLITLTGPGGSGKTRLAIEAARRLLANDGCAIWWVPLVDLTDPRLIGEGVRVAMRLPPAPETPVLDQVTQALSQTGNPQLLLLDNFEQLVEGGAAMVGELLERVPGLCCLITSRQLLRLPGEREFRVDPLPVPPESLDPQALAGCDSVKLFVDRAQAVRPSFQVGERNAPAVGALCRQLEGIPLALELAAAQIRLLSPEEMCRRLSRRFDFLASRRRDLLPRHRTLRAVLDASYQLLVPDLQRCFARLSVFRGGWTLEAATAVCSDGAEADSGEGGQVATDGSMQSSGDAHPIEAALAGLQTRSLLQAGGEGEKQRYSMLETLREYAAEQLAAEEGASLAERHARYYVAMAEEAEPHLGLTPQMDIWLERLEREHDNLRAATAWCLTTGHTELGLRLGGALRRFWWWRGYLHEGRAVLERLLALPGAVGRTSWRARALLAAGQLAATQTDTEVATRFLEEARAIHLELGEMRWATDALRGLAGLASNQGDYARARALYEEDLAIAREDGDKGAIAGILGNLGNVAEQAGDYAAARRLHAEGDALRREVGLPVPGWDHVSISIREGDMERARAILEEVLASDREGSLRDTWGTPFQLLALVYLRQGERAAARALLEEYRPVCMQSGKQRNAAECLDAFASLLAAEGDAGRAARLFGAAASLRERIRYPVRQADQAIHTERVGAVRAALGEESFASAWSEGWLFSPEQALDLAMA